MAIRIYALAKEYSMDSKELVEHCIRIGIKGKESFLACLTDDETKLVAESLGKTYSPPSFPPPPKTVAVDQHYIVPRLDANIFKMPVATARPESNSQVVSDQSYTLSDTSMSLGNALAIDALHAQAAELGAIVEALILKVLNMPDTGPAFFGESGFCNLIDEAFDADVFASLSADDLHAARMTRNLVVHRADGDFPSEQELRQSRNAFVLAALDLLEFCGESLKAEVLSDFKQHFPRNKRVSHTQILKDSDFPSIDQPRDL